MKEYTYTSESVAGEVFLKDGKNAWKPKSPNWWRHVLSKFKEGEEVSVVLTSKKPKRTKNQNNFYFAYLTLIAEASGHSVDELHEWAKGVCLPSHVTIVLGDQVRVKQSTTNLSTGEFSLFIATIAEKVGIAPPDPKAFYLDSLGPISIDYPEDTRDITPAF
jgi:hypothetical protein